MAKQKGRRSLPRTEYNKYMSTAQHFFDAAGDSMELEYWTAAGVLVIHSAIAFSDALCIKLGGVRSAADDHDDAITLLESIATDTPDKTKAVNHFKRILEEKTRVSYLGELYTSKQTNEMWKRLERFRLWSLDILKK